MGFGLKSGLGQGLQQAGQQVLEGVLGKRRLDFEQQKLDRQMAYKNRVLATQYPGPAQNIRRATGSDAIGPDASTHPWTGANSADGGRCDPRRNRRR